MQELVQHIPSQPRVTAGPFQFAIDHCFSIKGQGTVMTGTVLAGQVTVNDSIELPELKVRLPAVPQPVHISSPDQGGFQEVSSAARVCQSHLASELTLHWSR